MTYSIVAFDVRTGAAGVATATGGLAVGAFVPHARAGVGAIATQGASTNWLYGELGLERLSGGASAAGTLEGLVAMDGGREYRQCMIIDRTGATAGWTGSGCLSSRRHACGQGVAAAGNRLRDRAVIDVMLESYRGGVGEPMAARLLSALQAAEAAGGDLHGTISCALRVDSFEAPPVEIRVDYDPDQALAGLADLYQRFCSGTFRRFYETVPTRRDFNRHGD